MMMMMMMMMTVEHQSARKSKTINDRETTGGRAIAYSERKHEFTFAINCWLASLASNPSVTVLILELWAKWVKVNKTVFVIIHLFSCLLINIAIVLFGVHADP